MALVLENRVQWRAHVWESPQWNVWMHTLPLYTTPRDYAHSASPHNVLHFCSNIMSYVAMLKHHALVLVNFNPTAKFISCWRMSVRSLECSPIYINPCACTCTTHCMVYTIAGTEYQSWLLWYSLPILQGILPSAYYHHYSCLVAAIGMLLGTQLTRETTRILLNNFCCKMSNLYGEDHDDC